MCVPHLPTFTVHNSIGEGNPPPPEAHQPNLSIIYTSHIVQVIMFHAAVRMRVLEFENKIKVESIYNCNAFVLRRLEFDFQ